MTTAVYWGKNIRDRLRRTRTSQAFLATLLALSLAGVHASAATDPAVVRLGQAITAYDKRDFFTTVHLLTAGGQPAKLRDYIAYYLANAELMTNDGEAAVRDLGRYAANPVAGSPLAGRISLLYAKALLGQHPATIVQVALVAGLPSLRPERVRRIVTQWNHELRGRLSEDPSAAEMLRAQDDVSPATAMQTLIGLLGRHRLTSRAARALATEIRWSVEQESAAR